MPREHSSPVLSDAEKERSSVETILAILGNKALFPWINQIEETAHFGAEDRAGVDFNVYLNDEFVELTGLSKLSIQVKSSEEGVNHFIEKGKNYHGTSLAHLWWCEGYIVLNGSWGVSSIMADFIAQLMNLIGIWGDEFEVNDFFSFLDQRVVSAFYQNQAQGLIERDREELLSWVKTGMKKNNG